MRTRIATIVTAAFVLSFTAPGAWSEEAAVSSEDAAVDCSTAQDDLARLNHEKLSTAERIGKGVSAIVPISLVVHTVKGTEDDTMKMATGDYNDKIDARIAEIKAACGLE